MTADFTQHKTTRNRWVLVGVTATLIIALIIPLSFLNSPGRNKISGQNCLGH